MKKLLFTLAILSGGIVCRFCTDNIENPSR